MGVTAKADTTFATRFSNVAFSVTDLTPDDGVAAAYDYRPTISAYELQLFGPNGARQTTKDLNAGPGPFSYGLTSGTSGVSLDNSGIPGVFGLQGAVRTDLGADGGGTASISQGYAFTLTAHSALNLSAHMLLQISPDTYRYQEGYATGGFSLWSPDLEQRIAHHEVFRPPQDDGGLIDQDYSFTYANTTDRDITVNVWLGASSYTFISAVPEPGTYAMLGVGLLTLAAAGRRRRRHAA